MILWSFVVENLKLNLKIVFCTSSLLFLVFEREDEKLVDDMVNDSYKSIKIDTWNAKYFKNKREIKRVENERKLLSIIYHRIL